MKGMDNLGRVYFQVLWHMEQLEDRYGKDDPQELEDLVRNGLRGGGHHRGAFPLRRSAVCCPSDDPGRRGVDHVGGATGRD